MDGDFNMLFSFRLYFVFFVNIQLFLHLIFFIVEICKYHNFFPLINETEYDPSIDEFLLGEYTYDIDKISKRMMLVNSHPWCL